jgi:hypothetical protein
VGGTVEMNNRGIALTTELNDKAESPDIPLRLLMMIVSARTTLSRVALPAEPVGLTQNALPQSIDGRFGCGCRLGRNGP